MASRVVRWTVLACAAVAAVGCGRPSHAPDRIVLIVADTLRRDHVSAYAGGERESGLTPNIDALAARGQAVSAHAAYSLTSMSMGALFTGLTPSLETGDPSRALEMTGDTWCGMVRFAAGAEDRCIPDALPTLADRIGAAGYRTIAVVSNPLLFGDEGFGRGFDDWFEVGVRAREGGDAAVERRRASLSRAADQVLPALEHALDGRANDRFFLYVHLMDAHDYRYLGKSYADAVRALDTAVGDVLAALAERGLDEGATVVLVSDHGERLGEKHRPGGKLEHYGNPAFEEVLAIPLVVAPAAIAEDAFTAGFRTQDLHHWLVEMAGGNARGSRAEAVEREELYVSELLFRTYRSGRFKSTIRRRDDKLFLYDLDVPGEARNFAREHPDVAAAHRARIDELTRALAAEGVVERALAPEEARALEALGYKR